MPPATLLFGAFIIIVCEVFLFIDVARRGWLVAPTPAPMPRPVGFIGLLGRYAAFNITAVCWVGYLFLFDGILTWLAHRRNDLAISPIRARPSRFVVAWLTSIPVWCFFDWINFYYMHAWTYHGLPPDPVARTVGYFIAFAAISPGMFLAAHLAQHAGLASVSISVVTGAAGQARARRIAWALLLGVVLPLAAWAVVALAGEHAGDPLSRKLVLGSAIFLVGPGLLSMAVTRNLSLTSFTFGVAFTAWSLLIRDPVGNLTLWVGLIYLLDPLNTKLGPHGTPSLLRDWLEGRYGRTISLAVGGIVCGLCWEFWNYWALSKWTYDLPFLGPFQHYRYFEMPLPGFLGFLPFAMECWVVLNTIIVVLERVGLRVAERLPDNVSVM